MRALRVALAALLVVSSVGALSGVAVAQSEPTATETPDEPEEVVTQLDSRVEVVSHDYDAKNGTFYVTFRHTGERSDRATVTVTEVIGKSSGDSGDTFGIQRISLRGGDEKRLAVSAKRVDGKAGVMVTSEESIAKGQGIQLWEDRSANYFGESSWNKTRVFGMILIIGIPAAVGLGGWTYLARSDDDVALADVQGRSL